MKGLKQRSVAIEYKVERKFLEVALTFTVSNKKSESIDSFFSHFMWDSESSKHFQTLFRGNELIGKDVKFDDLFGVLDSFDEISITLKAFCGNKTKFEKCLLDKDLNILNFQSVLGDNFEAENQN